MGNIPYVIDPRQFQFGERGTYVMNHGIHIWFNIGDLQMAANREALEYTPKTKKHIRVVVKEVVEKVAEEATDRVKSSKTYREACETYNTMKQEQIFRVFAGAGTAAKWKGQDVTGNILETVLPGRTYDAKLGDYVEETPPVKLQKVNLKRSYRSNQREWVLQQTWVDKLTVGKETILIEMDSPTKWKMKIEYYLDLKMQSGQHNQYGGGGVYIVAFQDDVTRDNAFKKWNLDEWEIVKVSDLPDPPDNFNPAACPTMSKEKKKKHTAKFFELKEDFATNPKRKSDNWELTDIDLDDDETEFIYISLDHFFPHMWKLRRSYWDLQFVLKCAGKLGITVDKLYGVKEKFMPKVGKMANWRLLGDVIFEAAQDAKTDLVASIARDESIRQAPHSLRPYVALVDNFPKGSPIRELVKFYAGLVKDSDKSTADEEIVKLMNMFGEDIRREAAKELDRLLEAVRQRYPLLEAFRIFPDGYHHALNPDQLDAVVQYVKIIEREYSEDEEDDF